MKLVYTKAVIKDVRRIRDPKLIFKIEETIQKLINARSLDEVSGIKRLKGHPYAYRIRLGNYRLGVYVNNETVILGRFLKRNDIYKVFPD